MKKQFLIFLPIILTYSLNAEPITNEEFIYYKIYPKTKYDLKKQLDMESPSKYHSNTKWDVTWDYKYKKTNTSCKITELNTYLDIKYTMPKIPISHGVKRKIRISFDNYYNALFKYEKKHSRIGLIASLEVERLLKKINAKTCGKLEKKVDKIANKVIKKYRKKDIDLDRKTKHGAKSGVLLNKYL